MSFNFETDTVVGYVQSLKGENSAQFQVFGYRNIDNMFIPNIKDFIPHGKVFCPSFFKIDSFPDAVKNKETVVEFSCIPSTSYEPNTIKDYYAVDCYKKMKSLPRLIKCKWTNKEIGLGENRFRKILSIDDGWFAYPYNPITKILFEEVKFENEFFSPVIGKEIRGYPVSDPKFTRFKIPSIQSEFFFSELLDSTFIGEPQEILDFMTTSQLKGWIKDKLKKYSTLNKSLLEQLRALVNNLPSESDILDCTRLSRAKKYLDEINLFDEELKTLLTSDSAIGKELKNQLNSLKEAYEVMWEQNLQDTFKIKMTNLELQYSTLKNEKESFEKERDELQKETQSMEDGLLNLIDRLQDKTEEIEKLENHKEIIFATVKALASSGSPPLRGSNETPVQICDTTKKAKIFSVGKRPQFTIDSGRYDSIEDFLVTTLKRNTAISDANANLIVDVLRIRSSFIPSVSWAYALAYLVGTSNVMTLTVEYDWLHYADFSNQGLQEYWKMAHNNPDQNYFLVIQNINMIPSECSLLPLLEVLSGVRPVLEGTDLGVPLNLYCLATVVSTQGDKAMGITLKPELFQTWGAFSEPNGLLLTTYHLLSEIEVSVSPKQLKDSLFGKTNVDQQPIIESTKALYYAF